MSDFRQRLRNDLEPILGALDPRERISVYHDMPYALFRYDPDEEFELRDEVGKLTTRLTQRGKRVTTISLAACLEDALQQVRPLDDWFEAERSAGATEAIETIGNVLSDLVPLVDLVAARMPPSADPLKDVVLIERTGSLFPVYRTFSLLEQLKGRVLAPTVLLYPGHLDGPAGLRFMGILDAEHNYRPKIF
ncbi:BREX protein BrxB domain-containing protein [Candidatus Viadribacter manganicus]|uniref:Cytoplasmic protein n=1 Tax=Candidatus Viadribacter manganicus TaxID=1759059 RepID=A0A1B1AHP8_9PROT|nr:BREX protein BrxB domain-containing protein [Candidatus Viadribacter manganicus]ANP46083.1 hypothetical protein ATE48_09190 [Candidatus Viadribacter manganicus]